MNESGNASSGAVLLLLEFLKAEILRTKGSAQGGEPSVVTCPPAHQSFGWVYGGYGGMKDIAKIWSHIVGPKPFVKTVGLAWPLGMGSGTNRTELSFEQQRSQVFPHKAKSVNLVESILHVHGQEASFLLLWRATFWWREPRPPSIWESQQLCQVKMLCRGQETRWRPRLWL